MKTKNTFNRKNVTVKWTWNIEQFFFCGYDCHVWILGWFIFKLKAPLLRAKRSITRHQLTFCYTTCEHFRAKHVSDGTRCYFSHSIVSTKLNVILREQWHVKRCENKRLSTKAKPHRKLCWWCVLRQCSCNNNILRLQRFNVVCFAIHPLGKINCDRNLEFRFQVISQWAEYSDCWKMPAQLVWLYQIMEFGVRKWHAHRHSHTGNAMNKETISSLFRY